MLGGGVIPADMLAELIAQGAKVRTLPDASALACESRYRPSAALAAFIRMYQMTCAFPGCNKPAHRCDLDHLTAWPAGATHPGNLRPLCREHHLLKTFCGWNPVAHPDGRTTWTAPTGHTYTTIAGAAMLFPDHQIDTPIPRRRHISLLHDHRDAKMPTRKRTRAQDRAYRIKAARAQNTNDPPRSDGSPVTNPGRSPRPGQQQHADHADPYREGQRQPHAEVTRDQQPNGGNISRDGEPAGHQTGLQPDGRQRDHEHCRHPQRIRLRHRQQTSSARTGHARIEFGVTVFQTGPHTGGQEHHRQEQTARCRGKPSRRTCPVPA
jgi:hypothetical protein